MKNLLLITIVAILCVTTNAQTKVTNVLTNDTWANQSNSYTVNGITYNWAMNPNNITKKINGFSTASSNYNYDATVQGTVKFRRKNNSNINGDYSLVFAEGVNYGTVNSMATAMPNNMEQYFAENGFNKGAENVFDNTGTNKNNIERLDWLVTAGYSTTQANKAGFVVMQKGNDGEYMPLNIAAITAIDVDGNPTSYGPVKKIAATDWENIYNSTFSNRVTKAQAGNALVNGGGGVHNRAGVYVTLQDLGIGDNVTVFGYSLFADDLPINTNAQALVQISDNNSFPLTSCCYCGLDLLAVTGLFKEVSTLPINIIQFNGAKLNDVTNRIFFTTSNYPTEIKKIDLLKSSDGSQFEICKTFVANFTNNYTFDDAIKGGSLKFYYRIKITKTDGSIIISNILRVDNNRGAKSFQLVTNPVRTNLAFAYIATQKENLEAIIMDGNGHIISTNKVTAFAGTNIVEVTATSTLANGIYFLQVAKNNAVKETLRFMKQ